MAKDWGHCSKCGGYGYLPHHCQLFEISREGDDDWYERYATSMESALEAWADEYDGQGDYTIVQAGEGGDLHMLIRLASKPNDVKRFHVFGETVAQYHAQEAPLTSSDEVAAPPNIPLNK